MRLPRPTFNWLLLLVLTSLASVSTAPVVLRCRVRKSMMMNVLRSFGHDVNGFMFVPSFVPLYACVKTSSMFTQDCETSESTMSRTRIIYHRTLCIIDSRINKRRPGHVVVGQPRKSLFARLILRPSNLHQSVLRVTRERSPSFHHRPRHLILRCRSCYPTDIFRSAKDHSNLSAVVSSAARI